MNTPLKSIVIILSIIFNASILLGQSKQGPPNVIHPIHPLEDAKNHYAQLQQLGLEARSSFNWMDTIVFQKELYSSYALMLKEAIPTYLSQTQFDFLVKSVFFLKNSSVQILLVN
jgi:hypothetical protein